MKLWLPLALAAILAGAAPFGAAGARGLKDTH
jgi:hypothetical protein